MLSLAAIADPTRRRIVELLSHHDRTVGEIIEEFEMSPPAISHHLKILRDAGLVTTRTDGPWRFQTLNPAGLQEIGLWLNTTLALWNKRPGALGGALRPKVKRARKRRKP